MASTITSGAVAALVAFGDATRLYALEGDGPLARLQVERWQGEEALSSCYEWTLDALSIDAHLSLEAMLGRRCALRVTLADGTRMRRSGLVREARLLGSDGGLARYRLSLVPWLWVLSQGFHSRVFQDEDVLGIAGAVFGDYPEYAAWKATPDARSLLATVRPRSYAVQYRETDLAFIERLLAEEGLGYAFVEDEMAPAGHALVIFGDSGQLPEDASSASDASGNGIRFHRVAAVEERDTIQHIGQSVQLAPDAVTLLSHDYKSLSAKAAGVAVQGATGRREAYDPVGAYAFADSREAAHYACLGAEACETLQAYWQGRGSVRTARAGTRFRLGDAPWTAQALPQAFVWTRIWHAGVNNLPAAVRDRLPEPSGDAVLGGHHAEGDAFRDRFGDDGTGLDEAIAPALWAQARAHGYAQAFMAIDAVRPFRPVLADGTGSRLNPRATAPGPQTAIVVGRAGDVPGGWGPLAPASDRPGTRGPAVAAGTLAGAESSAAGPLHADRLGRLKVRFHWMPAGSSCWLRVVQRYAGPGHGAQFLPRIGQEVLVDFLQGDIDRPIIVGALYNGQGEAGIAPTPGGSRAGGRPPADGRGGGGGREAFLQPTEDLFKQARDFFPTAQGNLAGGNSPAWHGQSADASGHANAAALSGIKTRAFDGNGCNQLVFDDTDHQGRIQFGTTQAATQLNLGHLIHQADNYRGSFRGTGFELRTDAYGAIRGEKGVLLSSYTIGAGEPAGDVTAVGALLHQHAGLAAVMSRAAVTHQTVPLSGHAGVERSRQSRLSEEAAPLEALRDSALNTVSAEDYVTATDSRDAGAVPHCRDALTMIAARDGFGAIAGQSLHVAAGETLNLGSGGHANLAVGTQLRMHASQAIGMLGGALQADGTGLNLVVGKGALEVQAQHGTLALRSRDDLQLVSVNASVEFAAKEVIHLATAGGAYVHLEGGQVTFGCPGKLTIHAGNHKLEGATHLSRELNRWDEATFDQQVQLALPSGTPAKRYRYEYTRADGARVQGVTDDEGWATVQQGLGTDELGIRLLGRSEA